MNLIIEEAKKMLSGEKEATLQELEKQIEHVVFSSRSEQEEKEALEVSLGLFRILTDRVDQDDDDEMESVFHVIDRLLKNDKEAKALDILTEAGISLTEPRYYQREMTNFRDHIIKWAFGLEALEKMSALGVDLNEALIKGRTPAFLLADRNRMMSFGSHNPEEDFAKAVEYFSTESIEALNMDGTSAAHTAIRHNHFEMVEAMIKKGIDINITEDQPKVAGTTLLHTACEYGFPKIVQMLMDAGADDTLKNVEDETAAHIAVSEKIRFKKIKDEERAEMLRALKHIDIAGKKGKTPLLLVQGTNHTITPAFALTPVFIEMGADVNHVDEDGNTALLLQAANYCFKDTMKALIKAGADVTARNKHGDTPLHLTLQSGNCEIARLLIKKGADYNVANEKRITPVQIAVEKGYDEVLAVMEL